MSTIPSRKEFQTTLRRAIAAGQKAAEERFQHLKAAKPNTDMIDECGSASIVLMVDGRTAWGRFIKLLSTNPLPEATVSYSRHLRCYTLALHGLGGGQEVSVATAAKDAAWSILQHEYGLDGYVDSRAP